MGWIADFFRLAWSFLYWNTRKTAYRRRGAQGRCPCHHPSDSGRAWETACAAVTGWNNPARFQRVCPLLQRTPAGLWRCSANRAEVRPFWGRAAVFYGSGALAIYLAATLAAFVFFRSVGYEVTYPGALWPPAWRRLPAIRAELFVKKYREAARAGDMQTALMSLSTAYALNPGNYALGRQLAAAWQASQPLYSDQVYRRLIHDHPGEAEGTAQVWFRALLARGDFAAVQSLASERILADPAKAAPWLNAFIYANRRTHDTKALRSLAAAESLSPESRWMLTLAVDLTEGASPADARARLVSAAANAGSPAAFYQVCRELIVRGFAREALEWTERRGAMLSTRDLVPLRLDALASLGWDSIRRNEIDALLVPDPSPVVIELLSAHLIRYPDAALLGSLSERLGQSALPRNDAGFSAGLALFCAAGAGRDETRMDWVAARIEILLGVKFRGLEAVKGSLLDAGQKQKLENYLPILQPLSLEVTYALFDHYAPVR